MSFVGFGLDQPVLAYCRARDDKMALAASVDRTRQKQATIVTRERETTATSAVTKKGSGGRKREAGLETGKKKGDIKLGVFGKESARLLSRQRKRGVDE